VKESLLNVLIQIFKKIIISKKEKKYLTASRNCFEELLLKFIFYD
jgi:hypothetical protein